jgi:hypothetical protein
VDPDRIGWIRDGAPERMLGASRKRPYPRTRVRQQPVDAIEEEVMAAGIRGVGLMPGDLAVATGRPARPRRRGALATLVRHLGRAARVQDPRWIDQPN